MSGLQLRNLQVGHDDNWVLSDVSVDAANGELCAVVGENGAGKSTLLDVIAGLRRPHTGSARLLGFDLQALSPAERATRISSLGQNPTLWLQQNVRAYIGQGLVAQRGPGRLLDAHAHDVIEKIASEFSIQHLLQRSTGQVSGGELRRIQIARCLVNDQVDAYVLDEPLSGVDIRHQGAVCTALKRRAERGHFVCFSVHDLGCAYDFANRVLALKKGRLIADGPPAEALTPAKIEEIFGIEGELDAGAQGRQSVLRLARSPAQ